MRSARKVTALPDSRRIRDFVKLRVLRPLLEIGQIGGLSLTPRHYYSEVPNLRQLRNDMTWRRPSSMAGVRGASLESQVEEAQILLSSLGQDQDHIEHGLFARAQLAEGADGFSPIDAVCLYRFLGNVQPKRIVQIGCGVSTAIALEWRDRLGATCQITCIEPSPSEFLKREASRDRIQLREERAQDTPMDVFESLESGDFLFVDSTHTTVPGSEVNRVILEVLPGLKDGTWVHFHDITFPYHFRADILIRDLFFWRETLLLQGFLTCNSSFRLVLSLSMLHTEAQCHLRELLPTYVPRRNDGGLCIDLEGHWPVSCYIQKSP